MDPTVLHAELAKLKAELASADRIDAQSRELLGEIMQDIARLTEARATGKAPGAARPLRDRLELAVVRFEAGHPTLAATTRRLVDLLGEAGL